MFTLFITLINNTYLRSKILSMLYSFQKGIQMNLEFEKFLLNPD